MKLRDMLTIFAALLLVGTSACSTTGSAESSDDETKAQAMEEEEAEEAEDEEMDDDDMDDEEMAADDEGEMDADEGEMADKKGKMAGMCPMQVEGTTAKVQKMDEMVALDFTTTSGDVEELRERIAQMAERHNDRRERWMDKKKDGKGEMRGKKHGKKHGKMAKVMAYASAETEEIDDGMRLKLTPKEADQMAMLQEHVQQHAQMMAEGEGCPMMMMKGKKGKMKQKGGMADDADETEETDED